MKKLIALAFATLAFASSASALEGEPAEGFSYQAFVGLNASTITNSGLGTKVGMSFGGRAQYFLPKAHGTYVSAGIDWSWKGASGTDVNPYINNKLITAGVSGVSTDSKSKRIQQMHYLEVPIHVGFHYNLDEKFGFYGEVGPYIAVGLAGGSKYKYDSDDPNIRKAAEHWDWNTFKNSTPAAANFDEDDEYRPSYQSWDAGIGFLVGAEYNKHYSLNFGFNWGLADLYRDGYREGHYEFSRPAPSAPGTELPRVHNFCFTLSFAYRF